MLLKRVDDPLISYEQMVKRLKKDGPDEKYDNVYTDGYFKKGYAQWALLKPRRLLTGFGQARGRNRPNPGDPPPSAGK